MLLVYNAYPWRFETTDLVFVSTILAFEIESWPSCHLLMLLLKDDSKHGLFVTPKPKYRLQFCVIIKNICAHYLKYIRILTKIFSALSSKDIKTFFY